MPQNDKLAHTWNAQMSRTNWPTTPLLLYIFIRTSDLFIWSNWYTTHGQSYFSSSNSHWEMEAIPSSLRSLPHPLPSLSFALAFAHSLDYFQYLKLFFVFNFIESFTYTSCRLSIFAINVLLFSIFFSLYISFLPASFFVITVGMNGSHSRSIGNISDWRLNYYSVSAYSYYYWTNVVWRMQKRVSRLHRLRRRLLLRAALRWIYTIYKFYN